MELKPPWLDRTIPESLMEALESVALGWLVEMARRPLVQGEPPIDLGLRADPKKKNTGWVTLYVGTTKAVDIAVDARGRFSLPFKKRALFAAVDPPFDVDWKRPRTLAELAAIAEPLSAHVEAAVQTVTPKYWGEGFLQVAVMRTNGAVAVDREVVPSYHDISTRRAWEKTYQVPLNAARARLAAEHHWASGWKPKGRELDCLAISDAGDLLAIEVKPGSANDLEQTPLQVSFYKQMLDKCVDADMERVRRAVETMARQRSRLGLASTAPAVREDPSVIPVIAVGTPSTERARDRFPLVLAALGHELELKGLQIWAIDGHGAVTTTNGSELPI